MTSKNNVTFMDTSFAVSGVSGWYPGQSLIAGDDAPPYSYTTDDFEDVKTNVINYAGNMRNLTRVEVA